MFDFLDKLRQKPKPVRQQIALFSSLLISSVIFFMWWTTFTAFESESSISVGEALSPVGALTEMASGGVDSFGEFTENLKSHVLQVQYEASSSDPSLYLGAAAESDNEYTGGSNDVVYPEEIYDSLDEDNLDFVQSMEREEKRTE
jgi:hypothetical protein